MKRRKGSRESGVAITEVAAACAYLIPLIFILLYAVWEASLYFYIKTGLTECARVAARRCAIAYGADAGGSLASPDSRGSNVAPPQPAAVFSNPTTIVIQGSSSDTTTPASSPNQVFTNIRMAGVVTSNSQFTATYTAPAPNNQDPAYAIGRVTVVVTYNGTFPSPDPLGFAARFPQSKPTATASYALEY